MSVGAFPYLLTGVGWPSAPMGSITPRPLGLGSIRATAKEAGGGRIPLLSLLQFLPAGSFLELLPWLDCDVEVEAESTLSSPAAFGQCF